MATLLDPSSVDLSLLQDRQVAVLGYDAVASAHALNLRDSGVDVRVGTAPDSRGAARAEADGLEVTTPEKAVAACDIVVVASEQGAEGHGEHDRAAIQQLLDAGTEPGDLVVVTSAGLVHGGGLTVPEGVDLALFRAVSDGDRLRVEYLDGRGCPAVVAVERDGSGAAWATLTAYAAAMGSLRSGAIVTTFEHDALATSFAGIAVHEVMQRVVEDAFDTLVEAGVEPEIAYLATLHELKTRTDEVYAGGYASQHGPDGRGSARVTVEALVPQLRTRMTELLARGPQAATAATRPAGQPPAEPRTRRAAARAAHPVEQVGREVRALMSWLR